MSANFSLGAFLKFIQDLPFATIGEAAASGGLNIPLDFAAGEAIVSAAVKDFYDAGGASAAPQTAEAAPATSAAIQAHVSANGG